VISFYMLFLDNFYIYWVLLLLSSRYCLKCAVKHQKLKFKICHINGASRKFKICIRGWRNVKTNK
jgi:hypothetical protein